eukprot:3799003-Rhodomonas_salina.1
MQDVGAMMALGLADADKHEVASKEVILSMFPYKVLNEAMMHVVMALLLLAGGKEALQQAVSDETPAKCISYVVQSMTLKRAMPDSFDAVFM